MTKYNIIVTVVIYVGVCCNCHQNRGLRTTVEEEHLNFTALGYKYGYSVEEHDVVTEDGYILKLFHIPGVRNRPVLLMHGFVDSADTFIIRGRTSLAVNLANRGYDVWAGNSRGNKYSRRHITLNPDEDKKYWDFSFHETGYYDLPALIDFILHKTGQESLAAVGHSQGNTIFYVLGSTKPEYNSKINILIAISPVCFLNFLKLPLKIIVSLVPLINDLYVAFGQEEFFGAKTSLKTAFELICKQQNFGYEICAHGFFFSLGGSDPAQLEPEFFPVLVAHYPTSTSRKNGVHISQLANSKSFSQYDYGAVKNLQLYQSATPAKYDLSKVKMRVAMLFGENDGITTLRDVDLLRKSLPNVVEYRQIHREQFNHLDGVWGRNMSIYLFPSIFEILEKYKTAMQ